VSEHQAQDRPDDTAQDEQDGPLSVSDEELPEDLQPNEDNPLAQPAGDDVPDDVLKETAGGHAGDASENDEDDDQRDDQRDEDGAGEG
jgi:hypothetical protein